MPNRLSALRAPLAAAIALAAVAPAIGAPSATSRLEPAKLHVEPLALGADVRGRSFEAGRLSEILESCGRVEVRGERASRVAVVPSFALWAQGESRPLARGTGDRIELAAGSHSVRATHGRLLSGSGDTLAPRGSGSDEAMVNIRRYFLHSTTAIDSPSLSPDGTRAYPLVTPTHGSFNLPWPEPKGLFALTLQWRPVDPAAVEFAGDTLVVFLRAIGETEKN